MHDRGFSVFPASMAEDLCASYCLNTKTYFTSTVYGQTAAVVDLVRELGVRIIRERIVAGSSTAARTQQQAMLDLANSGVRWHGTVAELADWPNAAEANREVMEVLASVYGPQLGGDLSALMHSFGGCNEVDGTFDPKWAAHARVMQQALWEQAKTNPLTRDIPVAGPSTRSDVTPARATELGDLSAWCDRFANAHMYNRGKSPTRNIDAHMAILAPCFPHAERWIFSETGYNNSLQDNAGQTVPEAASATYAVRGICDFFRRGAIYGRFELLDDPDVINMRSQASINSTADLEAHFGLVAMTEGSVSTATPDTWRKKPEFFATQRFLKLLSDRGSSFHPAGLAMRITGGSNDLQQLLVQKRDGKHYILLWRDVDVATTYPEGRSLRVHPDVVTVDLERAHTVAVYEPATSLHPVAARPHTRSVSVSLAGELVAIEVS